MQKLRKKNICYIVLFLLGMTFISASLPAAPVKLSPAGFALPGNGGVVARAILDGSQHQVHVDSSVTVVDSAFFNPSYIGDIDTSYTVQNVVTLMINEASSVYLRSAFSVTAELRIIYTTGANAVDSIPINLSINYDSIHNYNSRSSFVFRGAHRVTVKILSITSSVTAWDPTSALVVEDQLTASPDFKFSCSTTVTNITVNPSDSANADELPVTWNAVLGADQYDLEWTYIDAHALAANKYRNPNNALLNPDPDLVFINNSTRITTAGTSYNIPLIYDDSGTLFIRVRPVQFKDAYSVISAGWSSDASPSVMGQYIFKGHVRPLNWQSNISYAEDGKRKVVVQYYDGSLRNRQTVTKDNTTDTTIVAETYYDFQGRASIQVMPAPTLSNIIQYTAGFNVGINGAEYSQSNYDTLTDPSLFCAIHADSMSNASGASQYYSPNNPKKTSGLNQFIPDAHDYPFTETEYTQDNTGRISRQSGVGPDHKLGSGHETSYFYGTPDQKELDALFGTEVGYHSHYFKNMVRDANGQYSISYVDMHGRTIATALAGAAPSGMATLPSNAAATVTETLADSSAVLFQDLSMVSQKSIVVPLAGTYSFNYNLNPSVFNEQNCSAANICYTCLYDLEISISDNCNNQLLPGHKAYDTTVHNFSLGSISSNCSPSAMNLSFALALPEGSYVVTKKLSVNRDAYTYYRDSIYLPGNTCTSLQQFITQQKAIVAASNAQCAPTCSACRDSVGTWAHFWSNFIVLGGISSSDTNAFKQEAITAYQNALSSCSLLCKDSLSEDDDIRNAMLQDMTPPYGQYADTTTQVKNRPRNWDKYSIFYIPPADSTSYIPVYKLAAVHYLDQNGNPDSVYNQQSGIMVDPNSLSENQFIQNFRSSWASALLPYHPEYCKLLALQAQKPSNIWDRRFEAIDNYQDAYTGGYLNPTGNTTDAPFTSYTVVAGNIDPLSQESSALKTALETKIKLYLKGVGGNPNLSMWAMVCMMVKCNAGDAACINFYATASNDFNTSTMCQGDLDMAWRNFRQLYAGAKQDIMATKVLNITQSCGVVNKAYSGVPNNQTLFAAGHQAEFTDKSLGDNKNGPLSQSYLTSLNQAGNNPGYAAQALAVVNDSMQSYYAQNANAYTQQWIKQLSPCNYSSTQLNNNILPALKGLCLLASDIDHPYGASSLPPGVFYTPAGTSYTFASFQDILSTYNTLYSITNSLYCNTELVTAPAPYSSQPIYSAKPVYSRPSDCECKLITDLYNTYSVTSQGDASFAAYLLRTQHVTLSDADLAQLRTMCSNTTSSASCRYLSKPIYLPPSMQCNSGSVCASCILIDTLYLQYLQRYPADTPSLANNGDTLQGQKNLLFQNFLNNRLGYSMQANEYLQFMDTCSVHAGTISTTTNCIPKTIAHIFKSGGTDVMSDMGITADSGYILVGSTTVHGAGGTDAYIIRYDHAGNIQWSKTYGGTKDDNFSKVKVTSDNGYIAVGTTKSGKDPHSDMLIVKLNAFGNTLWTKTISYDTTFGETGFNIIQTSDGGYAAIGDYNLSGGSADFLVVRLDSSGTVKWAKNIGTSTSDDGYALAENHDTLLVSGRSYDGVRYLGTIYKLTEDSGKTVAQWHYRDSVSSDLSFLTSDIYPTGTGYKIYGYNTVGFEPDSGRVALLNIDLNGAIQSFKRFDVPPGNTGDEYSATAHLLPTLDGGYLLGQTGSNTANIYWQKINSSGTLLWARQTKLPGSQTIGSVVQDPDGSFTALGADNGNAMLLNISDSGRTGCTDSTVVIAVSSPLLSKVNWPVGSITAVDHLLPTVHSDTSLLESIVSLSDSAITCPGSSICYTIYSGPSLCGKSQPLLPSVAIDSTTTCTDSTFFAVSSATELSKSYNDSLTGNFERRYDSVCLNAYKYERFTMTHTQNEYHYTLYYYDQAGNLVKTIPPAGVQQNNDTTWLAQVSAARAAGLVKVPAHTLKTEYRYNTLNQVMAQHSPDAGSSLFWYDRLGRLSESQNAKQNPNNQYSYTQYDSIGRIVQVGQLTSTTAIADSVSRNETALLTWQNNAASTKEQITQTVYDSAYSPLDPDELAAHNLRNRVSWSALYNTATALDSGNIAAAAATYYSYDILGSVDTLVQDYNKYTSMGANGNRFKKLVYQYDLISGKVNQVSFQHGAPDAFYHNYFYDAENRITNVQSSTDSVNWDNDAFYSYYAHGPLARTILGEQQVQGINYAYSLHGWLKAINPPIYTGTGYNLQADGSAGNAVAASKYNLLLNYYNGDFSGISGATPPDASVNTTLGIEYRPLFNGNISSMGLFVDSLKNPLLYNYQYDQLNRLVRMDAWNRTSAAWSVITKLPDFQESASYDANGNILKYKRNGNNTFAGSPIGMDSLNYSYTTGTNKLDHINDSVPSANYATDIDNQSSGNYKYDSIGNLVYDNASNLTNINWTVYGKIASITKGDGSAISYTYDAGGNRISKTVASGGNTITTWYVRDASGNVLSVYTSGDPAVHSSHLTQTELHIYGSSRLGMLKSSTDVQVAPTINTVNLHLLGTGDSITFTRGNKLFELSNHLGNVLVTISDKKYGVSLNDSIIDHFIPQVVSANDYYPFGMLMPGRDYATSSSYRYGFNGKENDNEVKGSGNQIDFDGRVYDPRIGKFLSVDPMYGSYPGESNYGFAGNSPIQFTDFNGFFKISPFFIKRYPTLARIIQDYLPLLKDNPKAKEGWISALGFNNHAEGEKAFDDMVTYGSGPWITPTRIAKEQKDGFNRGLDRFFEPTSTAGEFDQYHYSDNLSINHFDLDALEIAMKKGNTDQIGQQMLIVSVLIMHESAHWGKWKYNCCEVDDYRSEMGAIFEFNTFGKRFSYQNPGIASLNEQAFNREDIIKYYNQEKGGYGSPTFGFSINNLNTKDNYWKFIKNSPFKSGQIGDPTLKDNKDNENVSLPKPYTQVDHQKAAGTFSYEY